MSERSYQGTIIEAQGLVRRFDTGGSQVFALRGVDLKVLRGEFLIIRGRSGSGKTTLLNILGGLDRPNSGSVLLEGQDITGISETQMTELRRYTIGYVFQSYGLIPLLSAYENVELPLRINGVSGQKRRQLTQEVLDMVGLGNRSKHRPYELSGGEQQRVSIARALVTRPSVVLADEPTGDLDSTTGLAVATLMKDLGKQQGVTIVITTHDPNMARMGDRIMEMVDGTFVGGP
jgi:putative ABC transport system ATP-binding protein